MTLTVQVVATPEEMAKKMLPKDEVFREVAEEIPLHEVQDRRTRRYGGTQTEKPSRCYQRGTKLV